MSSLLDRVLLTRHAPAVILIRLFVGLAVFLPEGLQKLLFPQLPGAGRFAAIGIPWPRLLGPFVGAVEIVCGLLIILGFFTRVAAIPLIIVMVVAILSTKVPILLGHDFLIFHLPHLSRYGFWSMQHEARTDLCMLLACVFLLIVGGGGWSVDRLLTHRVARRTMEGPDGIRSS